MTVAITVAPPQIVLVIAIQSDYLVKVATGIELTLAIPSIRLFGPTVEPPQTNLELVATSQKEINLVRRQKFL